MYGQAGFPPSELKDLSHIPSGLETYAHLEHVVGEETRLLEEAEEARKQEHRERLHEISGELDRVWETLRERAERLGRRRASSSDGS
jgi:predicted nuclease with TOPRIM domain